MGQYIESVVILPYSVNRTYSEIRLYSMVSARVSGFYTKKLHEMT